MRSILLRDAGTLLEGTAAPIRKTILGSKLSGTTRPGFPIPISFPSRIPGPLVKVVSKTLFGRPVAMFPIVPAGITGRRRCWERGDSRYEGTEVEQSTTAGSDRSAIVVKPGFDDTTLWQRE